MFISKLSTTLALTALASFATLARADQPPLVTPLMTKALADIPGKEVEMLLIEYPPDGVDPPHRHDAHGFIYVIEGTIIMQVKGGKRTVVRQERRSTRAPRMFISWGKMRAAFCQPSLWPCW